MVSGMTRAAASGRRAGQRGHEEGLLMHLPILWKIIEKIKFSTSSSVDGLLGHAS